MKFAPLLLLPFAVTLCSCDGAAAGRIAAKMTPKEIGQPAKELDKAIMVVFQENDGDMWFGSDIDGAYRYDGKKLTHFTTQDGLPHNRIREIKQDQKTGELLFNTFDGVARFNGKRFQKLTPRQHPQGEGWTLKPSDLWFKGTYNQNSVYRYDGETLHSLQLPTVPQAKIHRAKYPNTNINPYDVYSTYQDKKGHIWIGTGAVGLFRFDGQTVSWLYEDELTYPPTGGSFGIRSVIEDRDGKYWFCSTRYRFNVKAKPKTVDGVSMLDYTREPGQSLPAPRYFLSAIEDDKCALWMAGDEVWSFDGRAIKTIPTGKHPFFTVFEDGKGALWLGTREQGALKWDGKSFAPFKLGDLRLPSPSGRAAGGEEINPPEEPSKTSD